MDFNSVKLQKILSNDENVPYPLSYLQWHNIVQSTHHNPYAKLIMLTGLLHLSTELKLCAGGYSGAKTAFN